MWPALLVLGASAIASRYAWSGHPFRPKHIASLGGSVLFLLGGLAYLTEEECSETHTSLLALLFGTYLSIDLLYRRLHAHFDRAAAVQLAIVTGAFIRMAFSRSITGSVLLGLAALAKTHDIAVHSKKLAREENEKERG
jgi:hypothetical protein